jgi:O-antigen/teichoic acid export membrane protein
MLTGGDAFAPHPRDRTRAVLRSALLLLSGNSATALLTLVRNLVIARLIPVEDYGIAATFAIAMAVVEMVSALGMEQQIVQSKDGDDPKFQAAIQGFTVLRGLLSFGVLFLTAGLMADFLGIPDLAWAYQVMALVPLIRGFAHFDNHRQKREMRFGPTLWTQAGSAIVALLAVAPAYAIFPDYRVMLVSLLVQAVAFTAITHGLAERPYRLRLDVAAWTASTRFGWPLLINGILLFVVMHGEKLVVGRVLGLADLGILAMGLTLTMTPTLVLAKSMQNLFLPRLSAAQDDDVAFQRLAETTIQSVMALAMVYLLGVVLLGGLAVTLLLGEKYAALIPLMTLLAVQQTLRVFKAGGATVALARKQTANAMIANSVRVLALPVAVWVAQSGGGLLGVIAVAAVGEAAGFAVSLLMIRLRLRLSMRRLILPLATCTAAIAAVTLIDRIVPPGPLGLPGLLPMLVAVVAISGALLTLPDLRGLVATVVSKARPSRPGHRRDG